MSSYTTEFCCVCPICKGSFYEHEKVHLRPVGSRVRRHFHCLHHQRDSRAGFPSWRHVRHCRAGKPAIFRRRIGRAVWQCDFAVALVRDSQKKHAALDQRVFSFVRCSRPSNGHGNRASAVSLDLEGCRPCRCSNMSRRNLVRLWCLYFCTLSMAR